jgi:hypothetical protein
MKQLLFVLATIAISFTAIAQETQPSNKRTRKEERRNRINAQIKAEEEGVIAYKKHFAVGLKLTTDGYGVFFEKAYSKSVKSAMLYQLEITERKHQKEEKQSNPNAPTSPIIYGKVNFFYPVKLGVQKQILLGNKSNKNGVSITANLGGGLSLGLLRAYEVEVDKNGQRTFIHYDSEDSLLFKTGPYYGGPNLGKGWSNLKMTPGLYVKPGVRFDYGRYNDLLAALEVGVIGEFYSKKIPQMFNTKEKQMFISAYIAVMFGKRK